MKAPAKKNRRQIFVLTPEEKRTLTFVLAAFVLGLGTKYYRQKQAVPPAKNAIVEVANRAELPEKKRAEARRRKTAK
ncbi:MAG TPA: hypothetical protein VJU77_09800 [Chthoniobacterales bacterium]|nr:hypothetical protein [Chthoniobacterales bacterium]